MILDVIAVATGAEVVSARWKSEHKGIAFAAQQTEAEVR